MLTKNFTRTNGFLETINSEPVPNHLKKTRIPPAWKDVVVDPDSTAKILAQGTDEAGRRQSIYSPTHIAQAKKDKFERVMMLLSEWDTIKEQIEGDFTDYTSANEEEATVAYLIYHTGIRIGSRADTRAKKQAFGATTLQLRHVKKSTNGVRLQFVGKKGVDQNIPVNAYDLAITLLARKRRTTAYTTPLFFTTNSKVNKYIATLGSGEYTAKDFRTACGTQLALKLLGNRKRFPATQAKRKKLVNRVLDCVAKKLGNTRAVSRSSYVEPSILERIMEG